MIESCSVISRAKQLHHSVYNFIDKILSDNEVDNEKYTGCLKSFKTSVNVFDTFKIDLFLQYNT